MSRKNEKRTAALPAGMQVKVYGIARDDEHSHGGENTVYFKVWQVVKCYPRFVLMQDRYGIRECFTYWELRRRIRPPKRVKRPGECIKWDWSETD